jgi:lipopolysaccharide/colanic/teichoic acid biosynthesis glycosyltransferase
MPEHTFYRDRGKRIFDLICAGAAVIVLSPVLLILFVLVRIMHGSPVIFSPTRPGKDEKIFRLIKFRTMTCETDADGNPLPDEQRLVPYGRFLRSTSLDELPELFNILKGDMAIVGPRPLLVRDMVFMTSEQRKRHTVRQGLTGLAQVSGRNAMTWEDKLDYDLRYVQNVSFMVDFFIVLKTIYKVLKREGITEEGQATAMDLGDYLLAGGMVHKEEYASLQKEAKHIIEQY